MLVPVGSVIVARMSEDIDGLAKMALRVRLDLGWSKEEAARKAGISSITWKRIEDGLPVQDVKRRAVERVLGLGGESPLTPEVGSDVAALVSPDLNPDLAEFTDQELLREVEQRMLLLAGRLQGSGADLLSVTVDQDGQRLIVSHATKRGPSSTP